MSVTTGNAAGNAGGAARATLAAGGVALALLTLSACQKPSPNAHFTLGADTSSPEAADDCWEDGEPLPAEQARDCVAGTVTERVEDAPAFTTQSGDTFRVGVDPTIADDGWLLFVNGQPYSLDPFTSTYRSFRSTDLYAVAQRNQSANELPVPGELVVNVAQVIDDYEVEEIFRAQTQEEFEQLLFASFEGVWNARLEPPDEDADGDQDEDEA
jgi:hypothetical protein